MAVIDIPGLRGLVTQPSSVTRPPGSLSTAECAMDRDGIAESSRGYDDYGTAIASLTKQLFSYRSTLLAHYGTTLARDSDGAGTWSAYSGSFSEPASGFQMRGVEANRNFYLSTLLGIYKLTSAGATAPTAAGGFKALSGTATSTGSTGMQTGNTQVAYRIAWGLKDANENEIVGSPSQRIIATSAVLFTVSVGNLSKLNASSTVTVTSTAHGLSVSDSVVIATGEANFATGTFTVLTVADANHFTYSDSITNGSGGTVTSTATHAVYRGTTNNSVVFDVPSGITTSHFYRIYRSAESASASTEPNDELGLVYEGYYVSGTTVTVTDSVPSNLRGATLYTSPSQEGIANANEYPPYCKDLCVFKGTVFYANTQRRYLQKLTVLSASSFSVNDTVVIAGTTYTVKASETASSGEFKQYTTGTTAQNIEDTAKSLVRVINQYATNSLVYAYYLSGYSDLPGQILIETRTTPGASFTVQCAARGTNFTPVISSAVTASSETRVNRVYHSKTGQPEAVPVYQYLDIGSGDQAIRRIVAIRDSVYVFKDDGIFRITGNDTSSWGVFPFDTTARLKANESCAVLSNQVWCFSDQGVIAVSDSGVEVMSRDIETDLLTILTGGSLTTIRGVSVESERKYYMFGLSPAFRGESTTLCFNKFTNSWADPAMPGSSSPAVISNPADDTLYVTGNAAAKVTKLRRSFIDYDFAVQYGAATVVSASGSAVRVTTSALSPGSSPYSASSDLGLYQNATAWGRITSATYVSGTTWDLVVSYSEGQYSNTATGAANIVSGGAFAIQTNPIFGDSPGTLKHFRELALFLSSNHANVSVQFITDLISTASTAVTLTALSPPTAVGTLIPADQVLRTYVPAEYSRATWISVIINSGTAFSPVRLSGMSLTYESAGSGKVK